VHEHLQREEVTESIEQVDQRRKSVVVVLVVVVVVVVVVGGAPVVPRRGRLGRRRE
jgi:hypothetical protein